MIGPLNPAPQRGICDMWKERSAGISSPGGSPFIRVLSVSTTVILSTVAGLTSLAGERRRADRQTVHVLTDCCG